MSSAHAPTARVSFVRAISTSFTPFPDLAQNHPLFPLTKIIRILLLDIPSIVSLPEGSFQCHLHSAHVSSRGQDHSGQDLVVPASQARSVSTAPSTVPLPCGPPRLGSPSLPSTLLYMVNFCVAFRSHVHHPHQKPLGHPFCWSALVCLRDA